MNPSCCPKTDRGAPSFVWNANGNLALFPVAAPGNEIAGAFDGERYVRSRQKITHLRVGEKRTTGNAQATLIVQLWKRQGGANTMLASLSIDQSVLVDWASVSANLSAVVEAGSVLFVSFPDTSLPGAPTTAVNPDTAVQVWTEEA